MLDYVCALEIFVLYCIIVKLLSRRTLGLVT